MAWHSLVSSVFLLSITNVVCHPMHSDGHSLQRMPTAMPREGDEPPVEQTLSFFIQSEYKEGDLEPSLRMTQVATSGQTIYTRTSTGPVVIAEKSSEGQFIVLENTSSGRSHKSVDLSDWTLKNSVDDKLLRVYTFNNVVIRPGQELKIWARDFAGQSSLNDLVARDVNNWGIGSKVITQLFNEDNEEKARLTQETIYPSDS